MSVLAEHDVVEAKIAGLMGALNATTAQLVATIAEVDRSEIWATCSGIRSLEHWVSWQCGVSSARAQALVIAARRREELPRCSELFDEGQLTEDAMVAIARRAPAERDAEVAEQAPLYLYSQLVRVLGSLPKPPPLADPPPPRREVDFGTDGDSWWARLHLPIDEGKLVEQALLAARRQLFGERHPDEEENQFGAARVSWADAMVRVAESSLIGLSGIAKRRPADRYQVWVHLDLADGEARWHKGAPLPETLRRYLLCDADVRAVIENDGVLVELSSRLRTVDDKLRAYIEQRDGGCTVPGCAQRGWLQIHHIIHAEDGGPTQPSNLCCLCPLHHRLHHMGLLAIDGDPTTPRGLVFRDQHGRVIAPITPTRGGRPPDPPPQPFTHPTGEPLLAHYITWRDLN